VKLQRVGFFEDLRMTRPTEFLGSESESHVLSATNMGHLLSRLNLSFGRVSHCRKMPYGLFAIQGLAFYELLGDARLVRSIQLSKTCFYIGTRRDTMPENRTNNRGANLTQEDRMRGGAQSARQQTRDQHGQFAGKRPQGGQQQHGRENISSSGSRTSRRQSQTPQRESESNGMVGTARRNTEIGQTERVDQDQAELRERQRDRGSPANIEDVDERERSIDPATGLPDTGPGQRPL
jgi:hypothetical protein